MDAKQPKQIGRYEVLSIIGRGAMGVVYKARDPLIGRVVALKRVSVGDLLPEDQQREFRERFFREARAAGNLKHPNIVTVHDVGEDQGVPYMAMEYLEGGSLASLMKLRGALPLPECLSVVTQVASALAFAHRQGIVHRDIKPDNILLDKDGRAVVTDFGAARLQDSELTRTGEVLGTPYYMSPEQVLGEPLDGRSDLFSLGVIFYLMATGRRPFKGDTVSTICYHIVHSPPEPISSELRVPQNVLPVLERLLAKRREQRFGSGEELIAVLGALGDAPPTVEVPTPIPVTAIPSPNTVPVAAPGFPPGGPSHPSGYPPTGPSHPSGYPPGGPSGGATTPANQSQKFLIGGLAAGGVLAIAFVVLLAAAVGVWYVWNQPRPPAPADVQPPVSATETPEPAVQPPAAPEPEIPPKAPWKPEAPLAQPQGGGYTRTPPQSGTGATPQPPPPPPAPAANPAVTLAAEAAARDAEAAAAAAQQKDFARAFPLLDDVGARMEALGRTAGPEDHAAVTSAQSRLERSREAALQALAEWAKPLIDKGRNTFLVATDSANDDEEGIMRAYAEVYPVLRWKDRLPPVLRQSAAGLAQECKENLNEEEWEQAEALARGGK
jgi:serine/threonine-protein kinase